MLAASPGLVMTREALLEHVWGDSAYRDPRTVDVHIRHLREKIERDAKRPEFLFTVRGVGYRFRESVRDRFPAARGRGKAAARRLRALPLNSVRNRLVLLFFAITAAAVGFVYLYVVPQLSRASPPRS